MDWPSAGSGRTQTLSSTTRASSRPRTVRWARRRSSAAQRRSSGSGVCRSTAAAASSASRCSRPPGCGRRARSGVCTSRTGPGAGPTRTTRSGAVEPLVSQGMSGTSARAGVQRPAQHTTSSASSTCAGRGADPGRRARLQAGDAAGLAGADLRAVALCPRDQAGDQRFGQQVALTGEERSRGVRRDAQGRLERGGLGRVDEAGRVTPIREALHPGFEFGRARGRQLDVAGRPVPGIAVEVRRELGPGAHPGVVEVVIVPGPLVVRVQPGEAPPAGGAARLVLIEQRHPQAGRGQPGRHRGADDARADHHAATGRHGDHYRRGIVKFL